VKENEMDKVYIARLELQNFKGLRCFDLKPGQLTVLRGPNASGKTTALESVIAGLKRGGLRDELITRGEDVASVKVTMTDGTWVRRRRVRGKDPTIEVKRENGVKVNKAQEFLDGLCATVQFNPLEWISGADRVKTLLGALPLEDPAELIVAAAKDAGIDDAIVAQYASKEEGEAPLDKIARVLKDYYEMRHAQGVKARELEHWLSTEKEVMGEIIDPTDEIEANAVQGAALDAEIKALSKVSDDQKAAADAVVAAERSQGLTKERLGNIAKSIAEHEKQLALLRADESTCKSQLAEQGIEIGSLHSALDTAKVRQEEAEPKLSTANARKTKLDARAKELQEARGEYTERQRRLGAMDEKKKRHVELKEEYDNLDFFVKTLNAMPNDLLTRADMPVEGLTYEEGQVLLNGVDVRELSGAETIRLGSQLATYLAKQQTAQFILMDGLEALDAKQREALMDTIAEGSIQWIMTEVEGNGPDGDEVYVMGAVSDD
jgi:hypothetical protein